MSIMQRLQSVTGGKSDAWRHGSHSASKRLASAHSRAAYHHGKLVELNAFMGRKKAVEHHREQQTYHRNQSQMYAGLAKPTAKTIMIAASDEYNLHAHLQKLGYLRRQSRERPVTLTRQGRALTRKPATVDMHRYNHAEALAGAAHKALHAHLMGAGFTHRAGKAAGYHHYRHGSMHLTVAPHSGGGHRVRFYHQAHHNGKL